MYEFRLSFGLFPSTRTFTEVLKRPMVILRDGNEPSDYIDDIWVIGKRENIVLKNIEDTGLSLIMNKLS